MRISLGTLFLYLGKRCPKLISAIPRNKAEMNLKEHGYQFPPLWKEIPELPNSCLDLSIVIPVYNAESYLRNCLDSVCDQITCYSYEVVCVNDGSTDKSLEILYEYREKYPQLIVVISQENSGISRARNAGIENARGRYVGFVDNDDFVAQSYVESLLSRAYCYDADIVQTGIIEQDSRGTILSRTQHDDMVIHASDSIENKSHISGYIWCGVINKRLFRDIRFPVGFWYEDMITRMLLMRVSNTICIIGRHLYYKRIHDKNASQILWTSKNIKSVDEFWLAKSLIDYGNNHLGCKMDELTYNELLYEFGATLCIRTRHLGLSLHRSVFSLASDYLRSFDYTYNRDDIIKNEINRSLLGENYLSWIFVCLAQKFSHKSSHSE